MQNLDVVIIGGGVSGVGMGCQLMRQFSDNDRPSFKILEARDDVGGTWRLFNYPGVRSDSDMTTYSYSFQPWQGKQTLGSGEEILDYIQDTIQKHNLSSHIETGKKVTRLQWQSSTKNWHIDITDSHSQEKTQLMARFIVIATGYYDYESGYRPSFEAEDSFTGDIIHPQQWHKDYDYTDKKVVIIGSGATAVTLVPAMIDKASHVTMLQRSPTYIARMPRVDYVYHWMQKVMPKSMAQQLNRKKNIAVQQGIYKLAQVFPKALRSLLLFDTRRMLKGVDAQYATINDFTPTYNPWDERLCVAPDGDLFTSLKTGKASVVTDHIQQFDKTGILLKSGKHLDADLIITATGLKLKMLGGCELLIDDKPININELLTYKGVLVSDIPNAGVLFGYTNASWTLKIDLATDYLCNLLRYMQQHHYTLVKPNFPQDEMTDATVMGSLTSGYIQRAKDVLPRQGKHAPWLVTNHLSTDYKLLKQQPIQDSQLHFS